MDLSLLSTKKMGENLHLNLVDFHQMPFWIQTYNMPVERFNEANGLDLGHRIRSLIETDTVPFYNNTGMYMRVNIELNTKFPLPTGIDFLHENGNLDAFPIKIEKLEVFCFICGKFGYDRFKCILNLSRGITSLMRRREERINPL